MIFIAYVFELQSKQFDEGWMIGMVPNALPPSIIMGWRVRSWVQNLLSVCNLPIKNGYGELIGTCASSWTVVVSS